MLNHITIMGRITAPLELRKTPAGNSVLAFSIAVERDYTQNGEKQTDFINVVAWKNTAEFISKYFDKGRMICVEGSLQTRKYQTQNGENRTVTEVLVNKAHFTGEKSGQTQNATDGYNEAGFTDTFIDNEDDLPF